MTDYQAQPQFDHDPAVEIVDGMIWFNRQLRQRPALALLFRDPSQQLFERLDISLEAFRELGQACAKPFYELCRERGLLRDGVTLDQYVQWLTFIIVSLQTTRYPLTDNEFELRDLLRSFLVPSLMRVDEPETIVTSD